MRGKVPWAVSGIFWLISHSSCRRSSKRGVALFRVVASGAHAFGSVTVVARMVSMRALLEVRLVVALEEVTFRCVCAACVD
jgi:hypothetical protein